MSDDALLDALARGDEETRACLDRIMDACPGPAYQGIVLAKIANRLDPESIHRITEVEDEILEVLEGADADHEAMARMVRLERVGNRLREMARPPVRDGGRGG